MIIEVALAIVLALVILAFLPKILGLGLVLSLLALLAVCGILFFSWIIENPAVLQALLAVALGVILLAPLYASYVRVSAVRGLAEQLRRRRNMGYETAILEEQLGRAIRQLSSQERFLLARWWGQHDLLNSRDAT